MLIDPHSDEAKRLSCGERIECNGRKLIVTHYAGVSLFVDLSSGLAYTRPQLADEADRIDRRAKIEVGR